MKMKYNNKRRFLLIAVILIAVIFIPGWLQVKQDKNGKVQTQEKKIDTEKKEEHSGSADTVMLGVYVISVFDLDFPGNKVNADFYVWYNAKKDSMQLIENFEVMNAIEVNKGHETDEKRGKLVYQNFRVNSVLKKDWDITSFPFDEQTIEIFIEDYDKDNTKLVFIPDTNASKIDPNVQISGWKITDYGIKVTNHVYETNYGDPEITLGDYSAYSRAVVYLTIEREGKGLFFKLFIGLFISVMISLLTFFIDPTDLDPRFGLSVGAIFAAIASQYVISSTLPQNERFTLVDKLHDVSFIFIFLCILGSVISLHLKKQGKIKQQVKLDNYGFFVLSISYLIIVTFFVLQAI